MRVRSTLVPSTPIPGPIDEASTGSVHAVTPGTSMDAPSPRARALVGAARREPGAVAPPGRTARALEAQLRPGAPTRAELEQALDQLGVARDEARAAMTELLLPLDGKLLLDLLRRLEALPRSDAGRLVNDMRIDAARREGGFSSDPKGYVEARLRERPELMKPEWRRLAALPPAEVPALVRRAEAALEESLVQGFGCLLEVPDPAERAWKVAALRDSFLRVLAAFEPDLRGQLIGRIDEWPLGQWKRLTQELAMMGLGPDFATPRDPAPWLEDCQARWRKELPRDLQLLEFIHLSGYEGVGCYYREKDVDKPELVRSALRMTRKREGQEPIRTHLDRALKILCDTRSELPEVDQALRRIAEHGHRDERWTAVLALLVRGNTDVSSTELVRMAGDELDGASVLLELSARFGRGDLEKLPAAVLSSIVDTFRARIDAIDRYPANWIRYGNLDTIAFVRRIDLIGPKTAEAIADAEARDAAPRT